MAEKSQCCEQPAYFQTKDCCMDEPCCDAGILETASTCCEETQCCDSAVSSHSDKKSSLSVMIIPAFLFAFILGDYLIPGFFKNKVIIQNQRLQDSGIFLLGHSIGLVGLLGLITSVAVFARSFINERKVRDHMSKMNTVTGHGIAAGIGVATPFCSCSAVPVFTGFVRSGVPVSQAISFLVASPLVNEIAVIMLATWAGWAIAGAYAGMGFLIAIIAGIALKNFANPQMTEITPARKLLTMVNEDGITQKPTIEERMKISVDEAKEIISKTWVYILIGVGAGSLIHGWLPESVMGKLISYGPVVGVLMAVLIGMPLYSGIATVIPVISALAEKGMPMGTLLAFAMAVTGLSLPEVMLLRSVMKRKLLALYFLTVAVGIIFVGIFFNLVFPNA